MKPSFFQNKRITVFGLGFNEGGIGTVKFLAEHGAREIIVTDIKTREELEPSLKKLEKIKNITYVLGQHRPENFQRVDMVIKNPVIPWTNEYVKLAEQNGIPVEMDSSLFFAMCPARVIGITGSKGKTTTSHWIAHILEKAGKPIVRVGMGRISVLGQLEKITSEDTVVFELSSWRLSALRKVKKSPHIAVLTNIYPDHQNYYKNLQTYMADKAEIFRYQKERDILIANADSREVQAMAQDAPGQVIWYSQIERLEEDGAWVENGTLMVRRGGQKLELLPTANLQLKGVHNVGNALAAAGATLAFGLTVKEVADGLASFGALSDRLELVGEKDGVKFYNDTTATIPEAAIAAMKAFSEPIILIAGGSDKRIDFKNFAEEILKRTKGLVLLKGDGTEKLLAALKNALPEGEKAHVFALADSMAQALEMARKAAAPGDVVLLSPGAASFGMFKNEFDRGAQFREGVKALP